MFRTLYNYITGNTDTNLKSEPTYKPHPSWEIRNRERALLEARDQWGNPPLLQAVSRSDINALEDLLRRGAYIESRGNNGFTALAAASYMGFVPAVQLLIANHADLNVMSTGDIKRSPLSWAVHEGHAEVVRLLLEAGANPLVADSGGYTPAMLAEALGHADCLSYLESAEINVEPQIAVPMDIEEMTDEESEDEDDFWSCPVSMAKLDSPVTVPSGHTFSRTTLIEWFKQKGNPESIPCPMTRIPIPIEALSWGRTYKIEEAMSLNLHPSKPETQVAPANQELSTSQMRQRRLRFFEQNMSNSANGHPQNKPGTLASQRKL